MDTDPRKAAPDHAHQREDALARRLGATHEVLREREQHLSAHQIMVTDLRAEDADLEKRLRARAARRLNHAWEAERRCSTPTQRLRQRFRDAHLPLWWSLRYPLRFIRGALRLRRQKFRRQVAEIAESRLFDPDYYRAVTGVGPTVDVLARFLLHGVAAGESPHPLFDPTWYRLTNHDLGDAEPPFQHYVQHGGWELRSPHPLFDARHYLSQFPEGAVRAATPLSHFLGMVSMANVSPHPLFDPGHYLAQDPPAEADGNMLLHYLARGAAEHLDPHPLFSSRFYLESNPDLQSRNPLDHFVRQGAAEGRSPHPLFDVPFYWEQRPEIRRKGGNALLDYLDRALDDDVDPHPLFDSSYYLEQAPAVRALRINPLVHFLKLGWRSGLCPNPWFDPLWYLDQNPDVFEINPLEHFAEIGWREGCDPSPDFSLSAYIADHPDVAASGENPLEHHLRMTRGGQQRDTSSSRGTGGELHAPEPITLRDRLRTGRPRTTAAFTSLGRESQLDIYAELSNATRAAQATRPRTAPPPIGDVPAGLSVLILNRNAPELLIPLVGQLSAQRTAFADHGLGFEVLVGDTGSTNPDVLALYANLPAGVRVARWMRYNFSRCNNTLESLAAFDAVLFLNNDIILPPQSDVLLGAYRTLVSTPGLGVLGSVLFYPDGSIQHMGCALLDKPEMWGLPYHINTRTRIAPGSLPALATYPGVTGAFLMTRRSLFRRLGGFDPLYAAECQDIALCLEAYRLGSTAACAHLGPIVHIENATRPKGEENWSDRQRFLRKYGALIRSLAE